MTQPTPNEARLLADAARIAVPDERLPALAAGLALVRAIAASLASVDYGETEPAARFRAPGGAK